MILGAKLPRNIDIWISLDLVYHKDIEIICTIMGAQLTRNIDIWISSDLLSHKDVEIIWLDSRGPIDS